MFVSNTVSKLLDTVCIVSVSSLYVSRLFNVTTKLHHNIINIRVSPRKLAKPSGRLEGRSTGGEACFLFVEKKQKKQLLSHSGSDEQLSCHLDLHEQGLTERLDLFALDLSELDVLDRLYPLRPSNHQCTKSHL